MEIKKISGDFLLKTKTFLKETEVEARKVIWPERRYVAAATLIILIIVVLSSIYVMFLDYGFVKLFDFLGYLFKSGI